MIELKNLSKTYISKNKEVIQALDNFSYTFPDRGLIGVYGDSGCGKTTLLNLIGGIDTLTSGDILINNKSIKSYKSKNLTKYRNKEIGFIFQDDNLIDNLNVFDNVALSLSLRKVSFKSRKKIVEEVLVRLGMLEKKNKYPSELSGGEKQRVTIARALIKSPSIILADEPTGSLDKENSLEIMKILKELSKDKLVILVSHEEELIRTFSDEILKIEKGCLKSIENMNKLSFAGFLSENEDNKITNLKVSDSIKLAFKNLFYKKFKSLIVAFSLSLSIASLGLVLAIQSGFSSYLASLENETLARYPVSIESTSLISNDIFDLAKNKGSFPEEEKVTSVYNSNSFLRSNNITPEFISYLNNIDESLRDSIVINNSTSMNVLYLDSLNNKVKNFYSSSNSFLNDFANSGLTSWRALPENNDTLLEEYDVLKGSLPSNKNEAILIVNADNEIDSNILNSLGFEGLLNENKEISFDDILGRKFKAINNNDFYKRKRLTVQESEVSAIFLKRGYELYNENLNLKDLLKYQDLFGELVDQDIEDVDLNQYKDDLKEFIKYIDVPSQNEINLDEIDLNNEDSLYTLLTSLVSTRYLDLYRELNDEELLEFYNDSTKGEEVKITGILRAKKDVLFASLNPGVYYEAELAKTYKESNTPEFIDLNNDGKITSEEDKRSNIIKSYESNIFLRFDGSFSLCVREILDANSESNDYIKYLSNRLKFGMDEEVGSITIFPSNFEEKSAILNYIDKYNSNMSEENKIIYTDLTSLIFGNVETLIGLISLVLIIFSLISLVVTILLESLITYSNISERKHDIGILKSLGASRIDIFKIFSFESISIGLVSSLISLILILICGLSLNTWINSMFDLMAVSLVSFDFLLILIVILLGIALQFLASFVPIIAYSNKTPIETMKR